MRQKENVSMLKKLKRCLTALVAAAVTASCAAGCTTGKSTAYAMTIDGYELKAGIYIYYQNSAFEEAKSKAKEENSDLDTDDVDALKNVKIEGKDFLDWVSDKTMETCIQHVAVLKKFEEMDLKLDDKDVKAAANYAESYAEDESDNNVYYLNGIGEESLKEIILNSYRSNAVFDAVYGEGGTEGITDDQVKDYYVKNNARTKYVALDMHDSEGNELDDAGKKEIEELADKLLGEVKDKSGKELLTAFDDIQAEYDKYVSDKTAEASGSSDSDTAETTAAEEESTETTTTTTAAAADEEQDEDSDENTAAEEDSEAEDTEDTDAEDAEEDSEESTEAAVTTTAPEEESAETTETTTTTDPYANEKIVAVVTTAEDADKDEKPTYTPSEKYYNWLYDESTKYEAPEIIKDEENSTIYIAVKLDINERMTADDLWDDDGKENARFNQFHNDMQDKIDEWSKALNVEKNDAAIDRYDPLGYKQPETTAAAVQY